MQRERGKTKRQKQNAAMVRAVGKIGGTETGGREKSANDGRLKAERELSNKQEKAKGKGQESRHQHRFPPFFLPRAPLTFELNRSRGFLRASGNSMLKILILAF